MTTLRLLSRLPKFFSATTAITFGLIIGQIPFAQAATLTPRPLSEDTTGFSSIIGDIRRFVNNEGDLLDRPEAIKLDPQKLKLSTDYMVRAFFIDEGAGKKNRLDYIATGTTPGTATMFENISCKSDCQKSEPDGNLNIGDWVNLGLFGKGTQFDFQLFTKNDTDGAIDVYGANPSLNPDGLDHLVAYYYKNYVVLGFEDWFGPLKATGGRNEGSDRDFNDIVIAIDMPVDAEAAAVPEPTTMLGLALAGASGAYMKRRKDRLSKGV